MSRNMKIVVGVIAGLLFFSCLAVMAMGFLGARFFGQAMDPEQARAVARGITDYDLPPGYREIMGVDLAGAKMAVMAPENVSPARGGGVADGTLIMLMQAPDAAGNEAEVREQMLQRMGSQFGIGGAQMTPAGTREVTIRGGPVTLDVSEGTTQSGERVRVVSGTFPGNAGTAMIVIAGPTSGWSDSDVDAFLSSLR